ncbi:MAG: GNAT family protein [Chloroherpetonaceae bacterium]|nr:GNAT family N-acetyltransferase [Chloroherpetonaceae bacterium]MCS7210639.1 GNAT family N-acetyltransferase [Chloroherpetonaceae bacterium]MDW8020689.1 GNAT family protein [Chloroherpetonaceae bacterium]MDW8465519.1 GNAT family protein [Chloroherpetonaceae bacterium]
MRIEGHRLYIRPVEMHDAQALTDAINASLETLRPWMPWAQTKVTLEAELKFIENAIAEMFTNKSLTFCICLRQGDEILGTVGTHTIDWLNFKTAIGYWIVSAHQGKGYASEATLLLLEYLFTDMNLYRVSASAAPNNLASARVLEKLGFQFEGVQRGAFLVGTRWQDLREYAILQPEYKQHRSELYRKFLAGQAPRVRY